MSNKNRQTDSNDRRHNWLDVFARTRGSASDSSPNEQWHSEVPNIKLSRAFVVVLILHVVAVGGILAFEMFKPKAMTVSVVSNEEENNEVSSKEIAKENETEAHADAENDKGYERYIVRSGDSIRAIAESYKISRTELLAANLIDEDHPLVSGRILRIPKLSLVVNGGVESPVNSESENEDYIPLNALPLVEANPVEKTEEMRAEKMLEDNNDKENGFQLLASVPPVRTNETAPRAIPVSKTSPLRPPRIVKEISTNDFVASGNQGANQGIASTHTISSGDTLYRIARKYNVSVDSLLKLNPGVDPRTLGIGKTLLLP